MTLASAIRSFVLVLAVVGCTSRSSQSVSAPTTSRIEIAVTESGFTPASVNVPKGTPVTLVFTRKTDHTCAKEIVIQAGDDPKIARELPLNQPVEIAVTFPRSGNVEYACGMDMLKGVVIVD